MITILRPARILRREMEARGWDASHVADYCLLDTETVQELIDGWRVFTPYYAREIALALGTSPEFWLSLQRQYDEVVAASREKKQ